jgi:hypothetical protein
MEPGHASTVVDTTRVDDPGDRYVPGLVDRIGDRILILGESNTPTLELLRFRQTLTTSPGFEVALRRRVERLRHFRHAAVARTPTVEYFGPDRRLALLSSYTPGRRLSDVLARAQDHVLAASLLHQLTPALDALNDGGDGVGHGALTASRILVGPDGAPIIVEHVLGPALERLHLLAASIRGDLGIPVPGPDAGYPRFDGPTDCFQLALIVLSMLLGRSPASGEYRDLGSALHAAFDDSDRESAEPVPGLRTWLARALQLEREFRSIGEAREALRDVTVPDPADAARRWRGLREGPEAAVEERLLLDVPPPAELPAEPVDDHPVHVAVARLREPAPPSAVAPSPPLLEAKTPRPFNRSVRWAFVAVALVAVGEALVIALLLAGRGTVATAAPAAQVSLVTNEPGAPVMVDGRLAGVTPLDLSIDAAIRSIRVGSALTRTSKPEMVVGSTGLDGNPGVAERARVAADARPGPVPPPQRSGGIRVSTPIELELFAGDRRLGSTATGIVPAPAGRLEIDLVSGVLGYRSRQVVDVRPGQVAALTVTPPNGHININAVPWAEVIIDGKSVGETPIGNLSIPLGEHEIVFRHPQLGEVRRTAVVRSDAVARVSAELKR